MRSYQTTKMCRDLQTMAMSTVTMGIFMVIFCCAILNLQDSIKLSDITENDSSFNTSNSRTCRKNLSAANISGFDSLPAEIKDFLYYRHCRQFPMLLDLPNKCRGTDQLEDIFLLLVIKSPPGNYERREVLRKTWAKERLYKGAWIRRIFISGTLAPSYEKKRLDKLLKLEQQEHNDILQWDFNESFFNLTLKQMLFLEWMEKNCLNARFLLNGDDDVFANTDNMVDYLQSLKNNNGTKHLFIGELITYASPIRWSGSKYYIPIQVHAPDTYPPYCGGGGFILSSYTAMMIYKMSEAITMIPIDDVYMGMCLDKANLAPNSHMGVKTLGWYIPSSKLDKYDPCFLKDLLLIHRFSPGNIYVMWEVIHDTNVECGPFNKIFRFNKTVNFLW